MKEKHHMQSEQTAPLQLVLKILLWILAFLGALALSLVILASAGIRMAQDTIISITEAIQMPIIESPTAEVFSTGTIVSGIQPLGQLVSVSVEVAKADIGVSVRAGVANVCSHRANHVAQGTIEAGIDITQITSESITYDETTDTYTINAPAPVITSCRIDYIRQYERSGGNPTCGVDWDDLRLLAQYTTTIDFAEDTIEGGILNRAERESTLLLDSFVHSLTGSTVNIVYEPSDADSPLPSSCIPQLPQGWSYDAEQDAWVNE